MTSNWKKDWFSFLFKKGGKFWRPIMLIIWSYLNRVHRLKTVSIEELDMVLTELQASTKPGTSEV